METYKLELTAKEIEIVLNALNVRPHGEVRGLIDKMYAQAKAQEAGAKEQDNEAKEDKENG